ncbi:hypothetical protein EX30DRAFT_159666 [Ascodesmis nigricans]|uniref:Uncharacterized protein n=1 Tax=Ascodesmis nigricans TaxID=341454 RepID=A0A4V3SI15_9PEZI|nr:hypothetical protein EX30DRAFT_159666 [Ascodesmis nigricans]
MDAVGELSIALRNTQPISLNDSPLLRPIKLLSSTIRRSHIVTLKLVQWFTQIEYLEYIEKIIQNPNSLPKDLTGLDAAQRARFFAIISLDYLYIGCCSQKQQFKDLYGNLYADHRSAPEKKSKVRVYCTRSVLQYEQGTNVMVQPGYEDRQHLRKTVKPST